MGVVRNHMNQQYAYYGSFKAKLLVPYIMGLYMPTTVNKQTNKQTNKQINKHGAMHGQNVEFWNLIPGKCSLVEGNICNFEGM